MTQEISGSGLNNFMGTVLDLSEMVLDFIHTKLSHIMLLGARIYMGWIFFISGWLSLSPWDSNIFLYEYEYIPNISANSGIDISFISPNVMAVAGTAGELVLPVLLWLGLGTRFAAFGLIIMSGVIQLTYPAHGGTHYAWMLILGLITATGGGALSADRFLGPRFGYKTR